MSDERTPDTEEVRNTYTWAVLQASPDQTIVAPERTRDRAFYMFDCWLVAHDAKVKADAWDEGFKQGGPMHDVNFDDPDAHTRNPYLD